MFIKVKSSQNLFLKHIIIIIIGQVNTQNITCYNNSYAATDQSESTM